MDLRAPPYYDVTYLVAADEDQIALITAIAANNLVQDLLIVMKFVREQKHQLI